MPGCRRRDRRGRRLGALQAPADKRRQLRALQDLRHQGSLRDHHLGDAGGWGGAELPELVKRTAIEPIPGCGKQGFRTRVKSGRHWTSHATGVARMTTRATPANLSLSLSEQLETNHLWISQSRSLTPVTSWSVSTSADLPHDIATPPNRQSGL